MLLRVLRLLLQLPQQLQNKTTLPYNYDLQTRRCLQRHLQLTCTTTYNYKNYNDYDFASTPTTTTTTTTSTITLIPTFTN